MDNMEKEKPIKNSRIQRKFSIAYLLALVIPTLIVGGLLLVGLTTMLTQSNQELLNSDNQRVHAILFELTTQAYTLSEDICTDESIHKLLETTYSDREEFREAALKCTILTDSKERNAFLDEISIYSSIDNIVDCNSFLYADADIRSTDWYEKAMNQTQAFCQILTENDKYGNSYSYLSLIRRVPLPYLKGEAVLVIKLSDNYLKARISTNEYNTLISLNDGNIFFSNDRNLYGKETPYELDYNDPYYQYVGVISIDGNKHIAAISSFKPYQAEGYIFLCVYSLEAYRSIRNIMILYILTILLAIILPGCLMSNFIRHFSDRVEVLRDTVHKVSNEDYDISAPITGNDELSDVYADIDVMVANIRRKQTELYEAELNAKELLNEQQAMEYKMLASQINPHFLYNTLETIRMKAIKAGNREVADAIKLLGKSMRYVLENNGTTSTPLQNEIEYVITYLKIQKLRFEDRVNYAINIEEGLDPNGYLILPLLLQPVVENSISHGLEKVTEDGWINIDICKAENDCLKMTVSDNGSGLTAEELNDIRTKLDTPSLKLTSSIGLYNIHQRIKLYYGADYGITLESEKGKGTTVTLLLPRVNV